MSDNSGDMVAIVRRHSTARYRRRYATKLSRPRRFWERSWREWVAVGVIGGASSLALLPFQEAVVGIAITIVGLVALHLVIPWCEYAFHWLRAPGYRVKVLERRNGRLTALLRAQSVKPLVSVRDDAEDEWIAVEAGRVQWDTGIGVAGRRIAAMMTGFGNRERLILHRLTITNRSHRRTASLTCEVSVVAEGRQKPVRGGISQMNSDTDPNMLRYPLKLTPGDTLSGSMAFDVPLNDRAVITSCTITIRDHMRTPIKSVTVPAPGVYPSAEEVQR